MGATEPERIGRRDESAFDALYDRYRDSVLKTALRIVRYRDAAEDVVQEVFLRIWQKSDQWKGKGSVGGWILRIAANLSLNHLEALRRRIRHRHLFRTPEDEEDLLLRVADTKNVAVSVSRTMPFGPVKKVAGG